MRARVCVCLCVSPTLLSKDPTLVHARDKECGRLSETHEEVGHSQVDDENIRRCPQAATPAQKFE